MELWLIIVISLATYFLHELGHYLVGWIYGMKPLFVLAYENPIRMGLAVTTTKPLENPDYKSLINNLNFIVHFSAGGVLGILPIIIYGSLTRDYLLSLFGCQILLIYSLYEVTSSINECKFKNEPIVVGMEDRGVAKK